MKHILIVEDNPLNLIYVEIILKKNGYTFDSVDNGEDAYEYFKNNTYDTILMDIKLPIMDGITCTKLIRQYEKDIMMIKPVEIIAVTAVATELLLSDIFDKVIIKPFLFGDLLEALK